MKKGRRRAGFLAMCVVPATVLFIIFMIIPTFNVFRMSLYKWGGYSNKKTFVGLENFAKLMDDSKFLQSFQNTLLLIGHRDSCYDGTGADFRSNPDTGKKLKDRIFSA